MPSREDRGSRAQAEGRRNGTLQEVCERARFRRRFGTRWAPLVTPQQLQQLMRHESIQTTMAYYVTTAFADIERATIDGMQRLPNTSPNILPFKKTG